MDISSRGRGGSLGLVSSQGGPWDREEREIRFGCPALEFSRRGRRSLCEGGSEEALGDRQRTKARVSKSPTFPLETISQAFLGPCSTALSDPCRCRPRL